MGRDIVICNGKNGVCRYYVTYNSVPLCLEEEVKKKKGKFIDGIRGGHIVESESGEHCGKYEGRFKKKEGVEMKLFDLKGKVAFLTGAGGNLGPIWTEALLSHGARIYGIDLPEGDVRDEESLLKHKEDCIKYMGVPDIVINNAALDAPPRGEVSFFGNFEEIIDVNLSGAVRVARLFIDEMCKRGSGVIVNIGSIQGNIGADWRNYPEGFEKPVAYNCSKAALVQLSRSITVQYGRYGVRSVTIAFGPYDGGKLPKEFVAKFVKNVPLNKTVDKEAFQQTLIYACCCNDFAGQQLLVDSGYVAW